MKSTKQSFQSHSVVWPDRLLGMQESVLHAGSIPPVLRIEGWGVMAAEELLEIENAVAERRESVAIALRGSLGAALVDQQQFSELCSRVLHLESMLEEALGKLDRIQEWSISLWIPIESFAPEPYEVPVPFTAVVKPTDEGYEAGFFDANIHSSGDTQVEAIANLKAAILDTFDRLLELDNKNKLGPEPSRQLQVLSRHIRKL